MARSTLSISSLFPLIFAIFGVACGGAVGIDGNAIGGACGDNTQCAAGSRCVLGNDFPGGMCVVNCAKHEDCLTGSRCIKKEGGICLPQCELPGDCRGGYTCKGKENQFGGGESLVCSK